MELNTRCWLKRLAFFIVAIVLTVYIIDTWVSRSTRGQMYNDVASIPHRKVGLLLGTSKHVGNYINLYYKYRIEAAAALYHAGKIEYVLISGDNRHKDYNEPETMQADLLAAGVPLNRIVLDYAGFRTLDSILRCRDVFGETEITIISQGFHNARALFIANRQGMNAIAFNAHTVSGIWTKGSDQRKGCARKDAAGPDVWEETEVLRAENYDWITTSWCKSFNFALILPVLNNY